MTIPKTRRGAVIRMKEPRGVSFDGGARFCAQWYAACAVPLDTTAQQMSEIVRIRLLFTSTTTTVWTFTLSRIIIPFVTPIPPSTPSSVRQGVLAG